MPNPRKPESLKQVSGTARADRAAPAHIALPLVSSAPEPPQWLSHPHGLGEWRRLVPILHGAKLLTEASLTSLALLCSVFAAIVRSTEAGNPPTAALLAQYRAFASDFGLTPAHMQKIRPLEPANPKENRFAQFTAARAK